MNFAAFSRWAVLPLLFILTLLAGPAVAGPPATGPATAAPSLADALNPDGTLRAGADGSFDARHFQLRTAPDGQPVFTNVVQKGNAQRHIDSSPVGNSYTINVIAKSGSNIYVGGSFTSIGTAASKVKASHVAKWNGTVWSNLGAGISFTKAGNPSVDIKAMAVASNGDLYVGGLFDKAGKTSVSSIAKWNGTEWSSLGAATTLDATGPDYVYIYALTLSSTGDLYVGGHFTHIGGITAKGVARYHGTTWSSLGTDAANGVVNVKGDDHGTVYTLAVANNGDVYVGGAFSKAGSVAANNVAKWNGTTWSSLGEGIRDGGLGVYVLAIAPNGDVYACGQFSKAGSVAANNVAKWNGTEWSSLGTGIQSYEPVSSDDTTSNAPSKYHDVRIKYRASWVQSLVVTSKGEVYVNGNFNKAGEFHKIGEDEPQCVAEWNGTTWVSVKGGCALFLADTNDAYVVHRTSKSPGNEVSIGKWNGKEWVALSAAVTD